jgi:hypothetical protein
MRKKISVVFFIIALIGNVPLHGMDLDYPKGKKPSFRNVPKTKKDLEEIISPILKKHPEVSNAFTDFLDLVFGQENKTSPISLKLEVWNALVDRVFEKDAEEQTNCINMFYLNYTRLTRRVT